MPEESNSNLDSEKLSALKNQSHLETSSQKTQNPDSNTEDIFEVEDLDPEKIKEIVESEKVEIKQDTLEIEKDPKFIASLKSENPTDSFDLPKAPKEKIIKLSKFQKLIQNVKSWINENKVLAGIVGFATVFFIVAVITSLVLFKPKSFTDLAQKIVDVAQSINSGNSIVASAEELEIQPEKKDSLGSFSDTEYILKSKVDLTTNQIQENLKVEPKTNYFVERVSSKEFKILLDKSSLPNEINKFELVTKENKDSKDKVLSWAYQTKSTFQVLQTFPRDKAKDVKLNSGVEVTFSSENYLDFDKYFEITPKTTGKFEYKKRTAVFIPDSLLPKTLYTVKIKQGVALNGSQEVLSKDTVFQFETASTANENPQEITSFDKLMYEFSANDKPTFSIFSNQVNAKAKIYKFATYEDFLAAAKNFSNYPSWTNYFMNQIDYPTDGLSKVFEADLAIQNSNNLTFTSLPDPLSKGYYLAKLQGSNVDSTLFQVTNISAFSASSQTSGSLVWAINLDDKKPIANLEVKTMSGVSLGKTNDQGVSAFTNTNTKSSPVDFYQLIIGNEKNLLFVGQEYKNYYGFSLALNNVNNRYWNYLYSDKQLYASTDKINFWGVLKPREVTSNASYKIKLIAQDYESFNYQPVEVFSKDLQLNSENIFTDSFDFKDLPGGYYRLEITDNNQNIISSNQLEIKSNYFKPAYQITLNTDKKAYFGGEQVILNGKVNFYDGNSVPALELNYSFNGPDFEGGRNGEVKTDDQGNFSITKKTIKSLESNPGSININLSPKNPEDADIEAALNIPYFNIKTGVTTTSTNNGTIAKITTKLNKINLEKVSDSNSLDPSIYLAEPISNQNISYTKNKFTYDKVAGGTYYDFISKTNVTQYNYFPKLLETTSGSLTTDANGIANLEFPVEDNVYNEVKFSVKDLDQKDYNFSQTIYNYSLNSDSVYYSIKSDKDINYSYKIGEKSDFNLVSSTGKIAENQGNQFLFYKSQNGILDFKVQNGSLYNFEFTADSVPNIYLQGVYFDGKNYHIANTENFLKLDTNEKKLNISTKTYKTSYKPQEEVTVSYKVTDKDGKPVKTNLNLSVVDESIFSLSGNRVSLLDDLYRPIPNQILTYSSHDYPGLNNKNVGGAGGGGVRSNFVDTASFQSGETNENGELVLKFKLPDNLTQWRLTTQVISANLSAGQDKTLISTSLPFFTLVNTNNNFLVGDKPLIGLRAFGNSLNSNSETEFTINSPSLGIKDLVVKGKSFAGTYFQLSDLIPGTHEIQITAKTGDQTDSLIKKINVKNAFTDRQKSTKTDFNENSNFSTESSKPVKISFVNAEKGNYLTQLQNLYFNSTDRLESKLSNFVASKYLNENFDKNIDLGLKPNYESYKGNKGGLAILPTAGDDLELSAKAVDLDESLQNNSLLESYFTQVLDSKETSVDDAVVALYGLSSMKKPVLNQIQNLSTNKDLLPKTKLYLALSASKFGDFETARKLYKNVLQTSLKEKEGLKYIDSNLDLDNNLSLSSLTSYLAAILAEPEGDSLNSFVTQNQPKELFTNLEQLLFLRVKLATLKSGDVELSYSLNGLNKLTKIQDGNLESFLVSPEEFKTLKFNSSTGKVDLIITETMDLDKSEIVKDSNLNLKRSYQVGSSTVNSFSKNDLVKVNLDFIINKEALEGCYQISDYLPAGLKAVNSFLAYSADPSLVYPYNVDGQKVSFCVNKNSKTPISYLARSINSGTFKADSAVIQSKQASGSINYTEVQNVEIKN